MTTTDAQRRKIVRRKPLIDAAYTAALVRRFVQDDKSVARLMADVNAEPGRESFALEAHAMENGRQLVADALGNVEELYGCGGATDASA